MKSFSINFYLAAFLTALVLFLVLVPYAMVLGWNLITAVTFLYILIPVLSYLCTKVFITSNRLLTSISGALFFYAFMIFMIYKHYKSDQFQIMIYSIIPTVIVLIILHYATLPPKKDLNKEII